MLAPFVALPAPPVVVEWRPMAPVRLPVGEVLAFEEDLKKGSDRLTSPGPPKARFWWNGREATPLVGEPYGNDLRTGLLFRRDGERLETVRIRDSGTIGRIPFPAGRFLRRGYAVWTSLLDGPGTAPVDVRTGMAIPDGENLLGRFGANGRLDLFRGNARGGTYWVRRTNPGGTVQEVGIGATEIGFVGFSGEEDGPMAFRFEGSNVGNVANVLLNSDLERLPVMPDEVHDISRHGFLVSRVDNVVPPMEPVPKAMDLTLLDAKTGRVRWTRPMTSTSPRWCGEFPVLFGEKGVTVLSPSTGRALLTKPWPRPGLRSLGGDLFGVANPKVQGLRVFRLVIRRSSALVRQ